MFTHERLEAYKVAREFRALAHGLVCGMPRGAADTADQLSRAARSVLLNTAEGAGRRSAKEKAHFFDIARGSAEECAAILDEVEICELGPLERVHAGRELLHREVRLLSGLARHALSLA